MFSGPNERRIIPLRPAIPSVPPRAIPEYGASGGAVRSPEDAARHYLKFMLPSIPIAAFILTFVLCNVLLGIQFAALSSETSGALPRVDPSLSLCAAAAVGAITGALCIWIYFGYLRIAERASGLAARRAGDHPVDV